MRSSVTNSGQGKDGFTLIETLVALALMGLVLSALANITSQWLPSWNRGFDRIQRTESVSLALQRICDDLAASEYMPANRDQLLFEGSEKSVIFVRTALGPNVGPGLDIVRIGETTDRSGLVTVRSKSPFRVLQPASSLSEQIQFGDPVVLMRAPLRLSFSYAGRDRAWKNSWHEKELPTAIALMVRDATTDRVLSVSTVVSIHAEAPAVDPNKATEDAKDAPKPAADAAAAQDRTQ